jgi:hypothetical protein
MVLQLQLAVPRNATANSLVAPSKVFGSGVPFTAVVREAWNVVCVS